MVKQFRPPLGCSTLEFPAGELSIIMLVGLNLYGFCQGFGGDVEIFPHLVRPTDDRFLSNTLCRLCHTFEKCTFFKA